ncbi:MAG: efflux RND transporter permease subunit, partial [Oscillospiraceae bacterium]
VSKRQSASTFSVTDGVNRVVEEVNARDDGITMTILNDASTMIKVSIKSVFQTMLWGIGLAMLVLFIFFGDWRASLIVGTSIPLSLLVTIIAMQVAGFSFNMLSLGGLVIGIGMMVDNSIVVLESCFKNLSAQRTIKEAAIDGTAAVASSIFASTLTTVVVFLPIPFIKGMAGQLFGQLCFTIVFSLIASLISAVVIVPLVFYKLMPKEKEYGAVKRIMTSLEEGYIKLLPKTLKHKKLVVLLAFLIFVGSLTMVPMVGMELIPATDEGTIALDISTRTGLNVKKAEEIIAPTVKLVSEHPDVEKYSVSIGGGGMMNMMGGSSSNCSITAYLRKDREMSTDEVVNLFRHETAGLVDCEVKVSASNTTSSMSGGSNVDVPLQGNDYDTLVTASYQVEKLMNENPQIINVSSSVTSGKPQAEIKVDPIKSAAYGLMPMQVMGNVRSIMEGSEATTLSQNGRDYSFMVEYPPDLYSGISDLSSMIIYNQSGMGVALEDIAEVEYTESPQSITKL